jgi:hypothetical protein
MSFWDIFKDKRPRGIIELEVVESGLLGKMNGYPHKILTLEIRENERSNKMSSVDIVGGADAEKVRRDIYPDGSWIPTDKIQWIE